MATESPIRMQETTRKWSSLKEALAFIPSSTTIAAEDLKFLLKEHRFTGSGKNAGPNRSGSAPPSIEGSNLAIDNLCHQSFRMSESLENSYRNTERCQSEEQLRADPSCMAHYCSNVNPYPRLPPLHVARENRWLVRHIRSPGSGNKGGLTQVDDSYNVSLHLSPGSLPTHKEEPEDDQSPLRNSTSPAQHRDLQEDYGGSPSSVYNQSCTLSNVIALESAVNNIGSSSFLGNRPMNAPNIALSSLVTEVVASSNADYSPTNILSSSSLDCTGSKNSAIDSGTTTIESEMEALSISNLQNVGSQISQEQWQHSSQENFVLQKMHPQKGKFSQAQNAKSQMTTQGMSWQNIGIDHFLHSPSKFSTEVQPVLQSSGLTPPMYATTAAYMTSVNPYYPTMQAPGFFSPQYLGGNAMNPAVFPPYFAGYPPSGAIPLFVDGTAGPSYNLQTASVSTPFGISPGGDMQHVSKFYGQVGYPLQPAFADPSYMQYNHHPLGEPCGISGQYGPLASRSGVMQSQVSTSDLKKELDNAIFMDGQKIQLHRSGAHGNSNSRRGVGPNFAGNAQNVNILMQYHTSSLASPVIPGSPIDGTGFSWGKNETRFPFECGRNSGVHLGWPGQRDIGSFDDPQLYNVLEELKSGKGRRFELSDITGHVFEFSSDQHGSRFIQQKLETCSVEEKASVFKEVLPQASKLMTDVFGNYVIQKFFEYGSLEQRKELANQLKGQILPLSLQMYGCRVIQKALEVIELEQKALLVVELDGHVLRCVRDQNGNHVIQKCIESIPPEKVGFIISAFRGQVATLSMHPYGCRVIQRVLEHCTDELQCQFIVDEILESVCSLAHDQYGNYVTQHVLERGKPQERSQIICNLSGHVVQLSQHKFASNVVEKCLDYGDAADRDLIVGEIIRHNEDNDNLLIMMKDQYANYVVQKTLEICTDSQRTILLNRIRAHSPALKKYTYGKHIVARFEQLFGGVHSQASDWVGVYNDLAVAFMGCGKGKSISELKDVPTEG